MGAYSSLLGVASSNIQAQLQLEEMKRQEAAANAAAINQAVAQLVSGAGSIAGTMSQQDQFQQRLGLEKQQAQAQQDQFSQRLDLERQQAQAQQDLAKGQLALQNTNVKSEVGQRDYERQHQSALEAAKGAAIATLDPSTQESAVYGQSGYGGFRDALVGAGVEGPAPSPAGLTSYSKDDGTFDHVAYANDRADQIAAANPMLSKDQVRGLVMSQLQSESDTTLAQQLERDKANASIGRENALAKEEPANASANRTEKYAEAEKAKAEAKYYETTKGKTTDPNKDLINEQARLTGERNSVRDQIKQEQANQINLAKRVDRDASNQRIENLRAKLDVLDKAYDDISTNLKGGAVSLPAPAPLGAAASPAVPAPDLSGGMVKMMGPDGTTHMIPAANVQAAIARGAKVVQ